MKQTIQSNADVAQQAAAESARSPSPQRSIAPSGRLAQLAVTINGSPRGQALAQPKDAIQHSPRVQNLTSLAAEINQSAPAQLRSVSVNDDAGLEHEADEMGTKALAAQSQPVTDGAENCTDASRGNVNVA